MLRTLSVVTMLAASVAVQAESKAKPGESCHLKGVSEPLRCLSLQVPAHYDQAQGESLPLHVTIALSIRETAKPDPVFLLAGGPGQAGSEIIGLMDSAFKKLRQDRDLIFIDQRGTGRSGKLVCKDYEKLGDLPIAEQDAAFEKCLHEISADTAAYTTESAARDIDLVREKLGYASINVWGGSYGTRLGQTYARLFPERTRSLILDSVAAPDQILGVWGEDAEHALQAMFSHCAEDKNCAAQYPELKAQWQALQQRVSDDSFMIDLVHPRTGIKSREHLPYNAFAETIRSALYSTGSSAQLPLIISRAYAGDWAPFLFLAYAASDWSTQGMAFGLTLSVVCAEDMPMLNDSIIEHEKSASFLHAGVLNDWPRYCSKMKVKPVKTIAVSRIDVPVLLLSGALDPVTPPHRAESAMKDMSHAQHLIAKNNGHIVSHQGCAPKLLRDFVEAPDQKVEGSCLAEIRYPEFSVGNVGTAP